MKKKIFLAAILLVLVLGPAVTGLASAQYFGNPSEDGNTGVGTIEEALKLANEKVVIAEEKEGAGSGTPYFAADGVIGATTITAGIFGGIAAMFFVRARHGKYAALGRG